MIRLKLVTATAVLLLTPMLALAQTAAPNSQPPAATPAMPAAQAPGHAAMAACRADMMALCGQVDRGGGRKLACLKDNQAKLSPACRSAIQTVLDKNSPARANAEGNKGQRGMKACQADVASVCPGVEKGHGRIAKCLKEKAAKLSPGCQDAVKAAQARGLLNKQARAACTADLAALCASVEKGPATMRCLREKAGQASPGCQQALAGVPSEH